MRKLAFSKKRWFWIELGGVLMVVSILCSTTIPRMLSLQTRAKLERIQHAVDTLTQYLNDNQELLTSIEEYRLLSNNHSFALGSNGISKINGAFFLVVPNYSLKTVVLDMDKFLQDHPLFEWPTWEENTLEMVVCQSFAKPWNKSYTLDDLIVFSVNAQIIENPKFLFTEPYRLDRDSNDFYQVIIDSPLFDISNGVKSEGIFFMSSYDLGARKKIDAPIVPYAMPK